MQLRRDKLSSRQALAHQTTGIESVNQHAFDTQGGHRSSKKVAAKDIDGYVQSVRQQLAESDIGHIVNADAASSTVKNTPCKQGTWKKKNDECSTVGKPCR